MKLFKSLFMLAVTLFMGVGVSSAMGTDPTITTSVIAIGSLFVNAPQGALLTAIDNSLLVASLGDYYRKTKDYLHSTLLLGMDVGGSVEIWDDISDECPLPNLTVADDLVKPGIDPTFAPTANALAFDARILKVRNWKIDLLITPTELHKTWLGYKKNKGSDVYDMPFEQYVFNHILEKAQDQIRRKAFFKGVYNAVGVTTTDIFDGWGKKLDDAVVAGDFAKTVTGVINTGNVITSLEAVYDDLDEAYKMEDSQMFVSPELFVLYNRAYRAAHGGNTNYDGQGIKEIPLDGTMCMVKREPGLIGSQRVIATPKSNMVYGIDSASDANAINIQQFDRQIKFMVDAKGGVELKQTKGGAVAMNDQA